MEVTRERAKCHLQGVEGFQSGSGQTARPPSDQPERGRREREEERDLFQHGLEGLQLVSGQAGRVGVWRSDQPEREERERRREICFNMD